MKISDLIEVLGSNENDVQAYDLKTKEGYESFKKSIEELKNSDLSTFELFGIDLKGILDKLSIWGETAHCALNANEASEEPNDKKEIVKDAVKQMNDTVDDKNYVVDRKVIDHSEESTKDETVKDNEFKQEFKQEFKRPSELLTIPQKLQLHKLVQEYVDTAIKPFNKGILTNDQINDAYAGLYEFGAWILNKK